MWTQRMRYIRFLLQSQAFRVVSSLPAVRLVKRGNLPLTINIAHPPMESKHLMLCEGSGKPGESLLYLPESRVAT